MNWKKATLMMGIVLLTIIPVMAFMYETQRSYVPAGIRIQSPTLVLGLYSDSECMIPATTIDFGNMVQPNSPTGKSTYIYFRNEGDVPLTLYWNSTLKGVSSQLTEAWFRNSMGFGLNDTVLQPAEVLETIYNIYVPSYASVGTFNWTLTVWGVY